MAAPLISYSVLGLLTNTTRTIRLIVNSGFSGVPKARIYQFGGSAPAFADMTNGGGYYYMDANPGSTGAYVIEYQDTRGSFTLSRITCGTVSSGIFPEADYVLYQALLDPDGTYELSYLPSKGGDQTAWKAASARSLSLVNPTPAKAGIFTGADATTVNTWSPSELLALGLTQSLSNSVNRNSSGSGETPIQYFNLMPGLAARFTKVDATKFGGTNGSINVIPSGGVPSYTYLWSDGPTTINRSGLSAGNYSVTVTDTTGTKVTLNITISQPAALAASYTKTDVTTYGGSDGTITLNVSGGSGAYTYLWGDGSTVKNRSGLIAGAYTVTIKDTVTLESFVFSIVISQPFPPLGISFTKVDASAFGASDGSIDTTPSGGSGSYSYSWSDGPTTQDRSFLIAGTYIVTLKDTSTGLTTSKSITVNQPAKLVASYVQSNVTVYGGADGSITLAVSGGSGNYGYVWSDGPTVKNRTALIAGAYSVKITDAVTKESVTFNIIITQPAAPSQLQITYTEADVTSFGGSDGSIDITVSGGTGPYTYSWNDGITSQDRSGLKAGVYTVTVTDSTLGTPYTKSLDIVVGQPNPPIVEDDLSNLLDVPLVNSITFIVLQVIDNLTVFANHRNTLFIDQDFPGFSKIAYQQKVCRGDLPVVHFNSNFPSHSLVLKTECGKFVKAISYSLKEKNIGIQEDYSLSIRNHLDNPGKSRVYFNASTEIPIPISIGDVFEILNNVDGFNGSYAVVDIDRDNTLGQQYLVINKNYAIVANSSNALGRFDLTLEQYNVFESDPISFADVVDGKYYMELVASNDSGVSKTAISEPIYLKDEHEGTVCLDYKNIDNAFDVTWTTGYVGRVRIEAVLFKRLPGGERTMSRNSDFSLVKVSARKQRIFLLETYMLPPWLHEKLSVIFDMDFWKANGVQYQSSESYSDPDYIYKVPIANSSIKIEQVGWFGKYNSDDVGSVNDGSFILANGGYIKR
jgi:hypothetical protein